MIGDFVRRDGQRLIEGSRDYKIVGANVYYLGYVESTNSVSHT